MTMRLSEAIRLGAMLRTQAHGTLFSGSGSCAAGAALEATGIKFQRNRQDVADVHTDLFGERWAWTKSGREEACPVCGVPEWVRAIISQHLNDHHRWTREQIADWVATVEPVEIASPVSACVSPEAVAADAR